MDSPAAAGGGGNAAKANTNNLRAAYRNDNSYDIVYNPVKKELILQDLNDDPDDVFSIDLNNIQYINATSLQTDHTKDNISLFVVLFSNPSGIEWGTFNNSSIFLLNLNLYLYPELQVNYVSIFEFDNIKTKVDASRAQRGINMNTFLKSYVKKGKPDYDMFLFDFIGDKKGFEIASPLSPAVQDIFTTIVKQIGKKELSKQLIFLDEADKSAFGFDGAGAGAAAAGGGGGRHLHFVLQAHGRITPQCEEQFEIPPNITLGFFYNPYNEDTGLCITKTSSLRVCDRKKPPFIYEHPAKVPNLELIRMDDIYYTTGLYSCETKQWFEIPFLGSYEIEEHDINGPSACLKDVVHRIVKRFPNDIITIIVSSCGINYGKINPNAQKLVNIETGLSFTRNKFQNVLKRATEFVSEGVERDTAWSRAIAEMAPQLGGKTISGKTRRMRRK